MQYSYNADPPNNNCHRDGYLSACKTFFRHLFFIPASAVTVSMAIIIWRLHCMNIALIAMSGIRVCDEELLHLGLTLPGFVERSKTIASLPSLGLLTLSALTPPEHTVHYIEIPNLSEIASLPDGFDLVAISSYSAQIDEAYLLATRYRDNNVPVVMGGPHVSALPDEALKYCDAVVIGEGEPCWKQVLADCGKGKMKPVMTLLH